MGPTKRLPVFRAQTLNVGGLTSFSSGFPMGGIYRYLDLHFHLALVHDDGSTAIDDGQLSFVQGVTLRTPAGEVLCNAVNGRAMHYLNKFLFSVLPSTDAIAATTGTYDVHYRIPFGVPRLWYPMDLGLDTRRYSNLQLDISLGTIADLLGTVGSDAVTCTVDCDVVTVEDDLPAMFKRGGPDTRAPHMHTEIFGLPVVDPEAAQQIDLIRSGELGLLGFMLGTTEDATAGKFLSGTLSDDVLARISLETTKTRFLDQKVFANLIQENKLDHGFDTALTGLVYNQFCQGGSVMEMLPSGAFDRLSITWANDTPSTSQVAALFVGLRPLR